ncbi:germinal center-associated signaling and motility-like protein [Octodon degus]|uniref:Germinal center-associated signaling and motility-like protein n=1 Tax=Octodon degus TaxID=10160 RepID=A0A6P6DU66_OCTDE|nr:germinal center-associated signaling and motility-like protein [Octodon degus]
MGNTILRALCCVGKNQKSRKENRGVKRKRQKMTTPEGEFHGQDGKSKECPSTSNQEQDDAGSGCSEDVCYTIINHVAPRWPSLASTDHGYENVNTIRRAGRHLREDSETETEYALLRSAVSGASSCTPEHDYEIVLPQ